jgi:hypothetical protein
MRHVARGLPLSWSLSIAFSRRCRGRCPALNPGSSPVSRPVATPFSMRFPSGLAVSRVAAPGIHVFSPGSNGVNTPFSPGLCLRPGRPALARPNREASLRGCALAGTRAAVAGFGRHRPAPSREKGLAAPRSGFPRPRMAPLGGRAGAGASPDPPNPP